MQKQPRSQITDYKK